MKKVLFTILFALLFLCGYSQEQSGKFKTIQLTGKIIDANGDTIVANYSGIGNYLKNIKAGIDPLDAVNLQQMVDSISGASSNLEIVYNVSDGYLRLYSDGSVVDSTSFKTLGAIDAIKFAQGDIPAYSAYQMYADTANRTISVDLGNGVSMQLNQESLIKVYNNTASQIDDLSVVYGSGVNGNAITIAEATNTGRYTALLLATENIPAGSYGLCIEIAGKATGNTGSLTVGEIFVGTSGITNTRPEFPLYEYPIGACLKTGIDGVIQFRSDGTDYYKTTRNFWNGVFRESFDFRVSSNGSVITGTLTPGDTNTDMTMMFSDGFSDLDTSPSATISLVAGTDINPQTNYVYVPISTKVLTVSTSGFPSEEHIKVAVVVLQSATATKLTGALRNQNWNDHIQGTNGQGHLSHITARIRQEDAKWDSGTEATVVVGVGGLNVFVKNTAGSVYQMHPQNFPIIDMTPYNIDGVNQGTQTFTISGDGDLSAIFPIGRKIQVNNSTGNDATYSIASINYSSPNFNIVVDDVIPSAVADGFIGDDIHVVNDFTSPYNSIGSLTDITTDANGNSLNNTSFSIVVWGVNNKTGEESHLMANYPIGTYNKNFPDQAVTDAQNHSVYSIPKQFEGVGFLMARFTFVNNGGSWSLYDTKDLRGLTPNTVAGGGGAGGGGVTEFTGLTDVPNSYSGFGGAVVRVGTGETAVEFSIPATTLLNGSDSLLTSDVVYDYINTWAGTSNITTVGTIGTGIWQGTAIADGYFVKTGNWTGTFDGQEGSYYLSRSNHTGTQTASTISDFDTEVSNNSSVSSNTTHRGLTNNPHSVLATQVSDFDTEVNNNTNVTANTNHRNTTTGNPHSISLSDALGVGNTANTNIEPDTDNAYSLGSITKRWQNVYGGAGVFSSTVQGADPTSANHFVTRGYFDSNLGRIPTLGDVLTSSNQANNTIEPDTDNAYDLGSITKRWQNIYGGSGIFASTVQGADPTAANHFVTRGYFDSNVGRIPTIDEVLGEGNTTAKNLTVGQISATSGIFSSTVSGANPTADTHFVTRGYLNTNLANYIPVGEKGAANGVAPLGATSKISSIYLPDFAEDLNDVLTNGNTSSLGMTLGNDFTLTGKIIANITSNDFGANYALGINNGNGLLLSKNGVANNTNKVFYFSRSDTGGNQIIGYEENSEKFNFNTDGDSYFNGGNFFVGYTSNPSSYKVAFNGTGYFADMVTFGVGGSVTWGTNFIFKGASGRGVELQYNNSTAGYELSSTGDHDFKNGTATFGGRILCDNTTDATTTTDGSIQTDGGLSVVKSVYVGDNIDAEGEITAYSTSDKRLKKNIGSFSALELLNELNFVKYKYNKKAFSLNPNKHKGFYYGGIAQQFEKTSLNSLVHSMYGKFKGIDYQQLIPINSQAIKELKKENEELKEKVLSLEERIKKLESLILK